MISLVSDGLGGCLSLLSFSQLYSKKYPEESQELRFITNPKVFQAIITLLQRGNILAENVSVQYEEDGTNDFNLAQDLNAKGYKNIFLITPDYFGTAAPFDIEKTGILWADILSNKPLFNSFEEPQENNVFLSLLTAQENNSYHFAETLISRLCYKNQDHEFYFANVSRWNEKNISLDIDFERLLNDHSNFHYYTPDNLSNDLIFIGKTMKKFIGIDGGLINYGYCLGRQTLMLDSRFGNKAFEMRWRHNGFKNSVPLQTSPAEVSRLFNLLAKNPELAILNKSEMINISEQQLFDQISYKTKTTFNK